MIARQIFEDMVNALISGDAESAKTIFNEILEEKPQTPLDTVDE